MFVFLAVSFGLSFVFFGVGTGFGGLNDLWNSFGQSSSGPSKSDLQERLQKNPRDSDAARQLAAAYQQDDQRRQAISVLETYTAASPRDTDALAQLASLYIAQAENQRQRAIQAQAELQDADPAGGLLPTLQSPKGQPVLEQNPITSNASQKANERFNDAYTTMQGAYTKAIDSYKKIATAQPRNADVQIQIAQAAQSAQDGPTMVAAFKRFLALAPPEDPRVPVIRRELRRLEKQLRSARSSQSGG